MGERRNGNQSQNREITEKEQRNAAHLFPDYQSRRIERIQRLKKGKTGQIGHLKKGKTGKIGHAKRFRETTLS
jgi:hypothetical protein